MISPHEQQTRQFLFAILDGDTYAGVGTAHGLGKTAVEKRVKRLVRSLAHEVGIDGMDEDGLASIVRMRSCKAGILKALLKYEPSRTPRPFERPVSDADLAAAVQRTRTRSENPLRDIALLYVLFSTGAKPLEIARLEVRDYLNEDGSVREASTMREEASVNMRARPLYFASMHVCEAIDRYLAERVRRGLGAGKPGTWRGLDPHSRLFLTETGQPFAVVSRGQGERGRLLCRGILEVYRTILRRAGLQGVTTLTARRTVALRLRERGADEGQIGELLGVKDLGALRELLARQRPSLDVIVRDLV